MCVLLITRLLRGVGRWVRNPVNHTSWVAVVTPTDRPKSVRNCCLIELFCGVVCVVTLPLWHFCWYSGFCHRTGSDLLLFVFTNNRQMGEYIQLPYARWASWCWLFTITSHIFSKCGIWAKSKTINVIVKQAQFTECQQVGDGLKSLYDQCLS